VRLNCVGWVPGGGVGSPGAGRLVAEVVKPLIPLGRMGSTAEIAGMVAYLVGPESGFVTGASMTIDGGYVA